MPAKRVLWNPVFLWMSLSLYFNFNLNYAQSLLSLTTWSKKQITFCLNPQQELTTEHYWEKLHMLSFFACLEQNVDRGAWKDFAVMLEPASRLGLVFICICQWSLRREKERKGKRKEGRALLKDVVWIEKDVRVWRYSPERCLLTLKHPWFL